MQLRSIWVIPFIYIIFLSISAGAHASTCTNLANATELSGTCVPGSSSVCTLSANTTYKISAAIGTASSPLPPIEIPQSSSICVTNDILSGPIEIYAQSFWINGGALQIGTAASPIESKKKVTIVMTGTSSATHAPQPICVSHGKPAAKCSTIAKNSFKTPNARDITVSGGGELLLFGAKGLTALSGASDSYIHSVDYAAGTVDGSPIKSSGGTAVSADINQVPYFNTLSGSRSWTYLRYPAGPDYFDTDMRVQAPVDYSAYTLLDTATLKKAATQPKKADSRYLLALSNMVANGSITDWQTGDWLSVATTTFSPHETEMVQVCQVYAMANPDTALPSALSSEYGDVTGPSALPNLTVLVLAGAPSYKDKCNSLTPTPLKHYHFGSQAPTPGFFKSDAPTGYPEAKKGQAYSYFDGDRNNFGIDERAEVALLSRSIKLTSTAGATSGSPFTHLKDQYFGGHIAIMNHDTSGAGGSGSGAGGGSGGGGHHGGAHGDTTSAGSDTPTASVQIVGVEIEKFGQPMVGRYPIHFHRLNLDSTGEDSQPLLVQDTVVHHSFNKCFVVHDTMAVQLYNNSCVRTIGQGVYLEDGYNVAGNSFVRNHIAGVMAAALNYDVSGTVVKDGGGNIIGENTYWDGDYMAAQSGFNYDPQGVPDASDSGANTGNFVDSFDPSGFWITTFGGRDSGDNRPNVFVNNSVAGCQIGGSAYWFVRQDVADFASRSQVVEADLYPVFTGNRGHACYNGVMAGTNFATVTGTSMGPPPKPVPVGSDVGTSADAPLVIFDGLTMTQIENKAFWYRGVFVGVNNSRFSSLKQGMTLLGGGGPEGNLLGFWGLVHNSVFAGVTNNNVGRYSDCEGYYEKIGTGAITVPANTALPLEQFNEMAKCAPIDMKRVSYSTKHNNYSVFGSIVPNFNFQGYTFYDGPARMEENRFVNFRADPTSSAPYDDTTGTYNTSPGDARFLVTKVDAYRMMNFRNAGQFADTNFQWGGDDYYGAEGDAAFSWLKGNSQSVPPTQYAKGSRWENVNFKHQVFTEISNLQAPLQDGDKQTVEIDRDTTLSGYYLCEAAHSGNCSNSATGNTNHYPISLNNLDVFATSATTDEPLTRGRNNVVSSALMSPHKYATMNVGIAQQHTILPLTVSRDMPAYSNVAAATTMQGRGGNAYIFEAMVMNNMGYSYSTLGFGETDIGLIFSYSDAPVDTNFINRVGVCVGTRATDIEVYKVKRQWNSGVSYLTASPYWTTATYGLTDTSSTCPSVATESTAYATCKSNGQQVNAYPSSHDQDPVKELNNNYYNVLNANYQQQALSGSSFTEGYHYDSTSGYLYFNMLQKKQKHGPPTPVTPPYGTCNSSGYAGANGTRKAVVDYLKFSNSDSIGSALDVGCYVESGTPVTSELLTCPVEGCAVYTVGFTATEENPKCGTPPAWATISDGTAPAIDGSSNAVTYASPYLLYDAASQQPLSTREISVEVKGSSRNLERYSRYVAGGPDSTPPPAAMLPLSTPVYAQSPPPTSIEMAKAAPGGVKIIQYGVPTGTIWTFETGASSTAGQSATLTAVGGAKFQRSTPPYTPSSSISISPSSSGNSQAFYYSGTSATLKIGTGTTLYSCTVDFSGGSVSGSGCDSDEVSLSGTTIKVKGKPNPTGTIWTFVTGASSAAGQSATLTAVGSAKFKKSTPPHKPSTSLSVAPSAGSNVQSFYYSGTSAMLSVGSRPAYRCTVDFASSTVSGSGCESAEVTFSDTTITVQP